MAVRRTSGPRGVSLTSSAPSPLFLLLCVVVVFGATGFKLKRAKRKWEPPKINLTENSTVFTGKKYLTTVITDNERFHPVVTYKIKGPGADEPPIGHFWVDPTNGKLYQMKNLDRETKSSYRMQMNAYAMNGTAVEDEPLDIQIQVRDINDEIPRITTKSGKISEGTPAGSVVMQIDAVDNDQPGSINSQLNYVIESQSPERAFKIDQKTGMVTTTKELDYEKLKFYNLMVKVFDNGKPSLTSTSKVSVNVQDANDNMPVFVTNKLHANIQENMNNMEVGRVKVTDLDSKGSDAWKANYRITSGNEGGHFKIETDSLTNEGIITVIKAFDHEASQASSLTIPNHEATQASSLTIVTSNIESYQSSSPDTKGQTLQFIYHVLDFDERPKFEQRIIKTTRSEGIAKNKTLAVLKATSPVQAGSSIGSTGSAIKYIVGHDPAGIIKVDPKTGKVELTKGLDRESRYMKDGVYKATLIAVDEGTKQSSTATMFIIVTDTNDNRPYLVNSTRCICADTVTEMVVNVKDDDSGQNAGPFKFTLPNEMLRKWYLSNTQGKMGLLVHNNGPIPKGRYIVPITVQDNQGLSGNGNLTIKAIECKDNENEAECKAVAPIGGGGLSAGAIPGILAGLLGLLLLALLLLLCCCKLGTAKTLPGFAIYRPIEKPITLGLSPDSSGNISKVPGSAVPLLHGAAGGASSGAAANSKGSAAAVSGGKYQEDISIEKTTTTNQNMSMNASGGAAGSAMDGAAGTSMSGGAGGHGFGMIAETNVMDEVTHTQPNGNFQTQPVSMEMATKNGMAMGSMLGITTLANNSQRWQSNEMLAGQYGQQQMQFAAGNAIVQDRLYPAVEHQNYNFAEQMGTAQSDTTEYFVNESLTLLDLDMSVAAGDVCLVYTYEGSGNSVISLDCCNLDENEFPCA
uniref:cadherin-like protein 26 isoform X1 n=1 Tax=Myxine glutinosa TaxID=7769 RepID=UPI00358F19F8